MAEKRKMAQMQKLVQNAAQKAMRKKHRCRNELQKWIAETGAALCAK
jgi:hypothetical protein